MVLVRKLVVLLVMIELLSACAGSPAPVYDRSSNPYRKAAPTSTRVQRPSLYQVRAGDTLYSIAWRYGVDFRALATWNDIDSPFTIYPDQRLRLSPPRSTAAATPEPQKPTVTAAAPAPTPKPNPAKPAPPVKPPVTIVGPSTNVATSGGKIRWQWPTTGPVLTTFAANDPARKGVDIGGQTGQSINAAADGEVVYSGVGLIGYGELIIIKHDQQLLSAYAHNSKRLVAEGDRVTAGQGIAEMGSTGTDRVKLHFEIRKDGSPIDPQKYLPSR